MVLLSLAHAYPGVSARFGTNPGVQFFLLLLVFIGLVIYGFVVRALHGAVHVAGLGPLNRFLGVGLGLVAGTLLAGALVWGLDTYGGMQGKLLLHGSVLTPAVTEFFQTLMAFTERLFPKPEAEPEKPWWKRPLL
ncbi:MAG: CvpA family protein [Candidatus Binatia bacterium]